MSFPGFIIPTMSTFKGAGEGWYDNKLFSPTSGNATHRDVIFCCGYPISIVMRTTEKVQKWPALQTT